jgi:signal transduction histidine kinase
LGHFAGGIAHDFNNVLVGVLGFSEALVKDLDPNTPQAADAREIQKAGEIGRQMTRQLLAFSRQEAISPAALDLNAVITETVGLLQQLVGRGVTVELDLAPSAGTIWADRGQIQQLLVNLAVNARDAMRRNGTLRIETQRNASLGAEVALRVSDTGSGMSAEIQSRMFEPFFSTKGEKGTGLGLATVHGIVQQTNGTIQVESAVGKGTAFRVLFPAFHAPDTGGDGVPTIRP